MGRKKCKHTFEIDRQEVKVPALPSSRLRWPAMERALSSENTGLSSRSVAPSQPWSKEREDRIIQILIHETVCWRLLSPQSVRNSMSNSCGESSISSYPSPARQCGGTINDAL